MVKWKVCIVNMRGNSQRHVEEFRTGRESSIRKVTGREDEARRREGVGGRAKIKETKREKPKRNVMNRIKCLLGM